MAICPRNLNDALTCHARQDAVAQGRCRKRTVFEDCKNVDAVPGDNEVSITAFNEGNTVQGYMKTTSFNSTLKSEDPHLYILAIGIDQYGDDTVNLKYAVKDAKDIEEGVSVGYDASRTSRGLRITQIKVY